MLNFYNNYLRQVLIVSSIFSYIAFPSITIAENPTHKVVIEVTSSAQKAWESTLNNSENLQTSFPKNSLVIEIVVHGNGLGMLENSNSLQKNRIEELSGKGIKFVACENTMRKNSVSKDDLLPSVVTTDSGVAEIIRKQDAGWSYIRNTE